MKKLTNKAGQHKIDLQALKESEARFRSIVLWSPDAIIVTDAKGKIEYMNPAAERVFNHKVESFIGTDFGLPLVDGESTEIDIFRPGKDPGVGDMHVVETEWLNKKAHLITTIHDITERKRAEEREKELTAAAAADAEKKRANELEKAYAEIQEKTEALVRSKRDIENSNTLLSKTLAQLKRTQEQVIEHERLAALGQMASGIAHDFNNALMPILGFTDLLLSRPAMLDNREETIKMLNTVRTAAMNAASTVRRLTDFYRPSDEGELQILDLNKLIGNIVAMTQPKWKEEMAAKGIFIEFKTETRDIPHISGNESQLNEVFTNLILNAADAMPNGGTITILAHTHKSGKGVEIQVSDTGLGMTEEVRRRCMEPFFTTKGGRGTGLGLSMVYGLIQRHKGSVDIQSTPGKGTTVTIHLPFGKSEQGKETPASTPALTLKPMRILFIDDELSARDLIAEYLKADKHIVEVAESGKEGLKKFRERTFDLVITDRAMPEMRGDQVAAAIKDVNPETPVILLTGFGDMMNADLELPAGVDFIVSKPVTLDNLYKAISSVMSGRRSSVEISSRVSDLQGSAK